MVLILLQEARTATERRRGILAMAQTDREGGSTAGEREAGGKEEQNNSESRRWGSYRDEGMDGWR